MALFIFHCGGNINSGSLRSFIFNLIFYFPLRHLFLFWAINLCSFPFASAQNKWRYIRPGVCFSIGALFIRFCPAINPPPPALFLRQPKNMRH